MPALPRVNVGCGKFPAPGYVNVDNDPEVCAFVRGLGMEVHQADAHALPFNNGSVSEIYASHVLEHYPTIDTHGFGPDAGAVLHEFRRVLEMGGTLYAAVPDAMEIAHRIISEDATRETWIGLLFGYHTKPGDAHHWAYTAASLAELLKRHGFNPCGTWDAFIKNPLGGGTDCAGCHINDSAGNPIFASLNVKATKCTE